MKTLLIFLWVYGAMVAMAFWEAYVEGRNAWDKGKLGWKVRFGRYCLSAYHFYLAWVMLPLLLTLPFVLFGWDTRKFGIIVSAYTSGLVLEDFMWFVVNPAVKLSEFNPEFVDWYPWVRLGPVRVPLYYVLGVVAALLSWYFFWR